MLMEFFQTLSYQGPDHGDGWPAPPQAVRPGMGGDFFARGMLFMINDADGVINA